MNALTSPISSGTPQTILRYATGPAASPAEPSAAQPNSFATSLSNAAKNAATNAPSNASQNQRGVERDTAYQPESLSGRPTSRQTSKDGSSPLPDTHGAPPLTQSSAKSPNILAISLNAPLAVLPNAVVAPLTPVLPSDASAATEELAPADVSTSMAAAGAAATAATNSATSKDADASVSPFLIADDSAVAAAQATESAQPQSTQDLSATDDSSPAAIAPNSQGDWAEGAPSAHDASTSVRQASTGSAQPNEKNINAKNDAQEWRVQIAASLPASDPQPSANAVTTDATVVNQRSAIPVQQRSGSTNDISTATSGVGAAQNGVSAVIDRSPATLQSGNAAAPANVTAPPVAAQNGGAANDSGGSTQHDSAKQDDSSDVHSGNAVNNASQTSTTVAAGGMPAIAVNPTFASANATALANSPVVAVSAPATQSPAGVVPEKHASVPSLPLTQTSTVPSAEGFSSTDAVRVSELHQRAGGAEMRITMDTELFGAIDLRATVHQSSLTATINVQHADVQNLLATDLPALQRSLADQHFHVERISVLSGSTATGSGLAEQQARRGDASSRQGNSPVGNSAFAARAEVAPKYFGSVAASAERFAAPGRLSVLA